MIATYIVKLEINPRNFLKRNYEKFRREPIMPQPLLDGRGLIGMGFKEGPVIGKIQHAMVDLQLEGKLRSKADVKKWVRKKWIKKKPRLRSSYGYATYVAY